MSQETLEERLIRLVESGQHQEAVRELIRARSKGAMELSQVHLAMLVRDLLTGQDFNNAIPLMAEHIRRFPENRVTLQVNLTKLLLQKQRPQKALQVLKSIDKTGVDAKVLETIDTLNEHAKRSVDAEAKQAN